MMLAILLSNVLSLVGPLSSVAAFAATSGKVTGLSDQGIELSYTSDGDEPWTASGTTITGNLTATKGTCSDTNPESSLTIKNNKSSEATLSFSYSPELNNGTVKVDGASVNGKGTFSKSLQPGESITVYIKTNGGSTKITLTDIKLLMLTTPEVTFSAAEHGSYTVDGQVVSDTLERSQPSTESYHLVATADPGYRFLGMGMTPRAGLTCPQTRHLMLASIPMQMSPHSSLVRAWQLTGLTRHSLPIWMRPFILHKTRAPMPCISMTVVL